MKKVFIFAAVAAVAAIGCKKEKSSFTPTVPLFTKNVTFNVHQARDYSGDQYNGVNASLKLSVFTTKISNGETKVLWDSIVPYQSLRNFPRLQNPGVITRRFTGIDDSKESLAASYSISFKDALGNINQVARNEFAGNGNSTLTIPVKL